MADDIDVSGALSSIERASREGCEMCDLHWHREGQQRIMIGILEAECKRRAAHMDRLRSQRGWILIVLWVFVLRELWRWM